MDKAASWLQQSLDYEFHDDTLLQRALTHRSAIGGNNERLEFLGDAVLETVISETVYRLKPTASEGALSRLRASLVKDTTLAEVATTLGVGEHLVLGSGERKSGGHRRASILADALEALFGAVYLDAGFEEARRVIRNAYADRLERLPASAELRDPKTRLQELLQSRKWALPEYKVEKISGKAHQQSFEVSCHIAELDLRTAGVGVSRRDAEQEAAVRMLENLQEAV